MSKRVLVTGGRDFTDKASVFSALADEWARLRSIPREVFEADWDSHKKSAGIIRNIQMLKDGKPDCCVAFPGGRGTAHMVGLVRKAGLDLWVIG